MTDTTTPSAGQETAAPVQSNVITIDPRAELLEERALSAHYRNRCLILANEVLQRGETIEQQKSLIEHLKSQVLAAGGE